MADPTAQNRAGKFNFENRTVSVSFRYILLFIVRNLRNLMSGHLPSWTFNCRNIKPKDKKHRPNKINNDAKAIYTIFGLY